jgi:hypothetical protein
VITILASLGGATGILAIITAIIVIGRGIFKSVDAIQDLTKSVAELTQTVTELKNILGGHETRISILEDRANRSGRVSRN